MDYLEALIEVEEIKVRRYRSTIMQDTFSFDVYMIFDNGVNVASYINVDHDFAKAEGYPEFVRGGIPETFLEEITKAMVVAERRENDYQNPH